MSLVQLRDVHKVFHRDSQEVSVFEGLTLDFEAGSFTALMGPSGSGKSTMMNLIGCLDTPSAGSYRLDGTAVEGLKDNALAAIRSKQIGFVFQQFNLVPRATALENVELPLLYQGVPKARERAAAALESVGLGNRAHHFPNQLSGGELQRAAIARAIVTEPSLILADEPTGNLDSKNGAEILEIFDRLRREGRTIVLVTHDADIGRRAQRTIRLKDGLIDA